MAIDPVIIGEIFPFEKPTPDFEGDSVKTAFEKINAAFDDVTEPPDPTLPVDPLPRDFVDTEPRVSTFFPPDLDGWQVEGGTLTHDPDDGSALWESTGTDTYIFKEGFEVDSERYTHIIIDCTKLAPSTNDQRVSYKTNTQGYDFATAGRYSVENPEVDQSHTDRPKRILAFPMKDLPDWIDETPTGIKVKLAAGAMSYRMWSIRLVGPNSAFVNQAALDAKIASEQAAAQRYLAEIARNAAELFNTAASDAAAQAEIEKIGANAAAEASEMFAEASEVAKGIAETSRDAAIAAKDAAQGIFDDVTAIKDEVTILEAGAETHATNAGNSATAAAGSASAASTSAATATAAAASASTSEETAVEAATEAGNSAAAAANSATEALGFADQSQTYSEISQSNNLKAEASSKFAKFMEVLPQGNWTFDDGTVMGWTGVNASLSNEDGKMRVTHSGTDGHALSPDSLGFSGVTYSKIVVQVKLDTGTIPDFSEAKVFYTTTGRTAFNANYYVRPLNYTTLEFDDANEVYLMFDCEDTGAPSSDWVNGTIKQIRFDLGNANPLTYDIDYITILGKDPSWPYKQAQASATSASSASASETLASQWAEASEESALEASTSSTQAGVYRDAAVEAAENADGSAVTATTQAGLATSASNSAQAAAEESQRLLNESFPQTFTGGKEHITSGVLGAPESMSTISAPLVTDGTLGQCLQITGASQNVVQKAVLDANEGSVYEFEAVLGATTDPTDGTGSVRLFAIGVDGSYANNLNTSFTPAVNITVAGGTATIKGRFSDVADPGRGIIAWPAGSVYIRPLLQVNPSEAGSPVAVIKSFAVRDVTTEVNSERFASDALQHATEAEISADAAASSAITATTAASTATTQAGIATSASTQATNTAIGLFPSDFTIGKDHVTSSYNGSPSSSTTTAFSLGTDSSGPYVSITGIGSGVLTKGVLPLVSGRVYEIEATYRAVTHPTDGTSSAFIVLTGLDSSFTWVSGSNVTGASDSPISVTTMRTLRARFSNVADAPNGVTAWSSAVGVVQFRPLFFVNSGEAGSPEIRLYAFKVSDVTSQIASAKSAAAAGVSETNAASSKTTAESAAAAALTSQRLTASSQMAAMVSDVAPGGFWNFDNGTVQGWTVGYDCTISNVSNNLRVAATGADPYIHSPSGLSIDGARYDKVVIRLKSNNPTPTTIDGSWIIYYATSGHGFSGSYHARAVNYSSYTISQNTYFVIVFDMSDLFAGGTDWKTNTITQIRFDFGALNGSEFDIDFIAVSGTNPGAAQEFAANAYVSQQAAATSESNAAGSAAAAGTSMVIAASVGVGGDFFNNPVFANWSGSLPVNWTAYGVAPTKLDSVNVNGGGPVPRWVLTLGQAAEMKGSGISITSLRYGPDYYVIDVQIEILSGSASGSGIIVNTTNWVYANDLLLNLNTDPRVKKTGNFYAVKCVFQKSAQAFHSLQYVISANHTAFGPTLSAKEFRVHKSVIRSATNEEIRTFNVASEISAAVAVEAGVRASSDGAIEAKYGVKVDVNGYVAGYGLIATSNNGVPTATMTFLVDNFKVVKPGGAGNSSTPKQMFAVGPVNGTNTLVLSGDMYADGVITAPMLAIGMSGNQVENSDFFADGTGWATGDTITATVISSYIASQSPYTPAGLGAWRIYEAGPQQVGGYVNVYPTSPAGSIKLYPVEAGKRYELSVYAYSHRCQYSVYFAWYNVGGSVISYTQSPLSGNQNGNPADQLVNYQRLALFGTAPAGAVTCAIVVRKETTVSGQFDSWMWFTRVQFCEAVPNQTVPRPWSPAGITLVRGGHIITQSITADKLYITDLSAISANLGTIQVGSANIENLSIGTIKIQNNAVSVVLNDFTTSSLTLSTNNTDYTANTVAISTVASSKRTIKGTIMLGTVSSVTDITCAITLTLKRDGTAIHTLSFSIYAVAEYYISSGKWGGSGTYYVIPAQQLDIIFVDTGGSASNTYTLTAKRTGGVNSISCNNRYLEVVDMLK